MQQVFIFIYTLCFHADRNIRPYTTRGYTLTTFPQKQSHIRQHTTTTKCKVLATNKYRRRIRTLQSEVKCVHPILSLMEQNADILTWNKKTGEIVFHQQNIRDSNNF